MCMILRNALMQLVKAFRKYLMAYEKGKSEKRTAPQNISTPKPQNLSIFLILYRRSKFHGTPPFCESALKGPFSLLHFVVKEL